MYHDGLSNAYHFLGLYGMAKSQDRHHIEETKAYRKLQEYYTTHYHKLLVLEEIPRPTIIPQLWYKYTSMAVDMNTRRNAIKELQESWVKWETSTKALYQQMYQELCNIGEIAAAKHMLCYVKDVDKELAGAEKLLIKLNAIGFDMTEIMSWQDKLYKKEG